MNGGAGMRSDVLCVCVCLLHELMKMILLLWWN
jgi:hypothetical protein